MLKVATFSMIAFIDLSFYFLTVCWRSLINDAHMLLVKINEVKAAIQGKDKFNQGQDK